jgi:hypothetical protein
MPLGDAKADWNRTANNGMFIWLFGFCSSGARKRTKDTTTFDGMT